MKTKSTELINAGKAAKVALTAVMRKLILLANALLKANRRWTPKPAWIKTDTLASVDGSACDGAALQHISFVEVLLAL